MSDGSEQLDVVVMTQIRYTIEELAVLADLFDLESLPGVPPVELNMELRSLATRCLIVRGVLRMPDDGGVEVAQPHATLLSFLMDSKDVVQATRSTAAQRQAWSWFQLDDHCMSVTEPDDGIVTMTIHQGDAETNIRAHLTGEARPATRGDAVVELIGITRGAHTSSTHQAYLESPDGWVPME